MKTKVNTQVSKNVLLHSKKEEKKLTNPHFFQRWFSIANAEIIKIANSEMKNHGKNSPASLFSFLLNYSIQFAYSLYLFTFYIAFFSMFLIRSLIYLSRKTMYKEIRNAYLDGWQNKESKKLIKQNLKYSERTTIPFSYFIS